MRLLTLKKSKSERRRLLDEAEYVQESERTEKRAAHGDGVGSKTGDQLFAVVDGGCIKTAVDDVRARSCANQRAGVRQEFADDGVLVLLLQGGAAEQAADKL